MSRQARALSKSGLYNVIFSSAGKINLFPDSSDCLNLKDIIRNVKEDMNFKIYAYSFSCNRVHMFVREKNPGDISVFMKKILSRYVFRFNKKYNCRGSVFGNRYKSEPVEDVGDYLEIIRYIHQNHKKINASGSLCEKYCSYYEYITASRDITNINFAFNILHGNREKAVERFIEIHEEPCEQNYEITSCKDDSYVKKTVMNEINGKNPEIIKSLEKNFRNKLIRMLVTEKGISKSALSRITGLSRGTITYICKN